MIKTMFIHLTILLMLFTLMPLNAKAAQDTLTQQEVTQFVSQMSAAAKSRNHDQIIGMFSPNATIRVVVDGKTLNYTRAQYLQMLKQGSAGVGGNSSFDTRINKVQVIQNKAVVDMTVTESIQSESFGKISSTSKEMAMLEKINGRIQITQLMAQVEYSQGMY